MLTFTKYFKIFYLRLHAVYLQLKHKCITDVYMATCYSLNSLHWYQCMHNTHTSVSEMWLFVCFAIQIDRLRSGNVFVVIVIEFNQVENLSFLSQNKSTKHK